MHGPLSRRCGAPRAQVASLVTPRGPVWPTSRAAWAQAIIPRHKLQNRDPHSPRRMGKELRHLCMRAACRSRSPAPAPCARWSEPFTIGFAALSSSGTSRAQICLQERASPRAHGKRGRYRSPVENLIPGTKKIILNKDTTNFQVITSAHGITRASSSNSAQHNKIWAPRLKKTVFKLWRQVLIFKLYLRNFKLRMRVYHPTHDSTYRVVREAHTLTSSSLRAERLGQYSGKARPSSLLAHPLSDQLALLTQCHSPTQMCDPDPALLAE